MENVRERPECTSVLLCVTTYCTAHGHVILLYCTYSTVRWNLHNMGSWLVLASLSLSEIDLCVFTADGQHVPCCSLLTQVPSPCYPQLTHTPVTRPRDGAKHVSVQHLRKLLVCNLPNPYNSNLVSKLWAASDANLLGSNNEKRSTSKYSRERYLWKQITFIF